MTTLNPESLEKAAREKYDAWLEEVLQYAPPGESTIETWDEAKDRMIEEAEAIILAYLKAEDERLATP
jgi:hypothetical protein